MKTLEKSSSRDNTSQDGMVDSCLKKAVDLLVEGASPERIILFGSLARGCSGR